MSKVKNEIPDTKQGFIEYIAYCEKQIKENLLHNRRLQERMKWSDDKLKEYEQ